MKVPPKRKGNAMRREKLLITLLALNESPSEKEGKYVSPCLSTPNFGPSMKVPPKRKGNNARLLIGQHTETLNESPSEKEGK